VATVDAQTIREEGLESAVGKRFVEDGCFHIHRFFELEEMDGMRRAVADHLVDVLRETAGKAEVDIPDSVDERLGILPIRIESLRPGKIIEVRKSSVRIPHMAALPESRKVLDFVEQMIGPDIILHTQTGIPKLPGNEEETKTPWHQDAMGFVHGPCSMGQLGIWFTLQDTDVRHSTLWLVPGSHRWGLLPGGYGGTLYLHVDEAATRFEDLGDWIRMVPPASEPVTLPACGIPMAAGDLLCFNSLVLHSSRANMEDRVRWAFTYRFQSALASMGLPSDYKPRVLRRSLMTRFLEEVPLGKT
jgi:hypothetical protein